MTYSEAVKLRRLAVTTVTAVLVATGLTACIGADVRSTEDWLAAQPHVVSIGVPSSTVDELSYKATLRAELDPDATDAEIGTLIDDAIDYVAANSGDDVTLQFGMKGIDFEVADKQGARTALALWHRVIAVPGVVSGFVAPDAVSVQTLRADAFAAFDALAPLGVDRAVGGYHAASDFDVSSSTFQPPLDIVSAKACTPDATIVGLAQSAMTDDRVDFGTLDLCDGLDVTFLPGYALVDGVGAVRAELDAAGLDAFPVTISVAPASAASASFHIVAVTPGDPAALAVVAALEASALDLRYQLADDRTLDIESSSATAAQLLATLTSGTDALGAITIVGSDKTVTGAFADLAALVG